MSELEDWLLSKFRTDLGVPLPSNDSDIFSAGVDSLQTTRIWRTIKKDLDLGADGHKLSQNIVFEKGTVKALAAYLHSLRTGVEAAAEDEDEIKVMQELIEKYSQFTQHFATHPSMPEKEVVIVTGGTGNLGAFIISSLLKRPSVSSVWALVRAPSQAAAGARVLHSLHSRQIKLSDDHMSKLHALPADFSNPNLGLHPTDLERLISSVTTVIHSAWAVNFNLGVRSFEFHHIRGTYNLLNFCQRSRLPRPTKFYFCSSVSAGGATPRPASVPEKAIDDLSHAQKIGYGRSKLVTEHIVRNAMRRTGMEARVLRIGQLSGDRVSAMWNETEAVALMVRSAISVGALPALEESPSWLPVDSCAEAIAELSLSSRSSDHADADKDANLVYHLLNPATFNWKTDFLPTLQRHPKFPSFDIVSPQQWLDRLARSEPNPAKNPSIKLIDFWRRKYGSNDVHEGVVEASGETSGLVFETTRTVRDCASLGEASDPVSEGLVERYLDVWMEKWVGGNWY